MQLCALQSRSPWHRTRCTPQRVHPRNDSGSAVARPPLPRRYVACNRVAHHRRHLHAAAAVPIGRRHCHASRAGRGTDVRIKWGGSGAVAAWRHRNLWDRLSDRLSPSDMSGGHGVALEPRAAAFQVEAPPLLLSSSGGRATTAATRRRGRALAAHQRAAAQSPNSNATLCVLVTVLQTRHRLVTSLQRKPPREASCRKSEEQRHSAINQPGRRGRSSTVPPPEAV